MSVCQDQIMWFNCRCQMARPPELVRGGKLLEMPHMCCNIDDLPYISHAVIAADIIMDLFQLQPELSTVTMAILISHEPCRPSFASQFQFIKVYSACCCFLCCLCSWGDCFQLVPCVSCPFPLQLCKPKSTVPLRGSMKSRQTSDQSLWCIMSSLH